MPELPEVETIRRQLRDKIVGKELDGQKIVDLKRRGKILIIEFKDGSSLIFHLKLTGQLIFNGKPSKYTRKVFNFEDSSKLIFNDVRKFGWWKKIKSTKKIEEKLGPEPFEIDFKNFKRLFEKRPRSKIKSFLMDQRVIAGIGNIYSDEILYAAKINPLRLVKTLKDQEIRKIFQSMKKILKSAIKQKGSSVEHYLDAYGNKGDFVRFHKVYQKEGKKCFRCKSVIERIKINGRSARFCPKCQKINVNILI